MSPRVRFGEVLVLSAWLLAAATGVTIAREAVGRSFATVKTVDDLYALPDPSHLAVFSLGHRSALADLLFGKTLVRAGEHFAGRQVFVNLDAYLEAILALEPEFRDVYMYADSLLTLSTVEQPKRNYRTARNIQERGLRLFPDDADLWMSAGQFMAYLAPQWLPEEENPDEWRQRGAEIIGHACTIWPFRDQLPVGCLASTRLLTRLGETDAAIRSLERLVAMTDDPEVRKEAAARLEALLGEQAKAAFREQSGQLERERLGDLPLASRTAYQIIGPARDPDACLRPSSHSSVACASAFSRRTSGSRPTSASDD